MSPPDNDDTRDTGEGTADDGIRQAIQARFAHLSPEKQLRLKVELLRFLSQSVIMPRYALEPEDGDGEPE